MARPWLPPLLPTINTSFKHPGIRPLPWHPRGGVPRGPRVLIGDRTPARRRRLVAGPPLASHAAPHVNSAPWRGGGVLGLCVWLFQLGDTRAATALRPPRHRHHTSHHLRRRPAPTAATNCCTGQADVTRTLTGGCQQRRLGVAQRWWTGWWRHGQEPLSRSRWCRGGLRLGAER